MSENVTVPFGAADELDAAQKARTQDAPLPNARTLKNRKNLAVQLGKFIAFNLRFMRAFIEEDIKGNKRI